MATTFEHVRPDDALVISRYGGQPLQDRHVIVDGVFEVAGVRVLTTNDGKELYVETAGIEFETQEYAGILPDATAVCWTNEGHKLRVAIREVRDGDDHWLIDGESITRQGLIDRIGDDARIIALDARD